jgi:hypothetical protein
VFHMKMIKFLHASMKTVQVNKGKFRDKFQKTSNDI